LLANCCILGAFEDSGRSGNRSWIRMPLRAALETSESRNSGTPAISGYRLRNRYTPFAELYPSAGNHKSKFQKESLIFHFRVPRGAEYRAKRRDCVSPSLLRIISGYRYSRSFSCAILVSDAAVRKRECLAREIIAGNARKLRALPATAIALPPSLSLSLSLSRQLNFHTPIEKVDYCHLSWHYKFVSLVSRVSRNRY